MNTSGKIIGQHEGLPLYTIGQRRGINIGGSGPYYVVDKDLKKNILIVTNDEKYLGLFRKNMEVSKVNWIAREPKLPLKVEVRIRYRHPAVSAIIRAHNIERTAQNAKRSTIHDPRSTYIVEFNEPQRAISSGQSAVFYTKKGELLGGGIII